MASFGSEGGAARGSLEVEDGFNAVELTLEQRPLVGWALLAHLSTFIVMGAAFAFGAPLLGVPWFFTAIVLFMVGLAFKRPARLRVTRTELHVDAWVGRLARPQRRALPLDGVDLLHGSSGSVNRRSVYHLVIRPKEGEALRIGGLACTRGELARVEEMVERAGVEARLLAGEEEAEVPPELRALQRSTSRKISKPTP